MFRATLSVACGCVGLAAAAAMLSLGAAGRAEAEDNGAAGQMTPEQTDTVHKQMGPEITEAVYAKYVKLETALQLADQRILNAKDDAAKAELEKAKAAAYTDAGTDAAAHAKIKQEILMIEGMLMAGETNPQAASGVQKGLANFYPVSVATVKAHHQTTPPGTPPAGAGGATETGVGPGTPGTVPPATGNGGGAAISATTPETDVDPAKITGEWLLDIDTSMAVNMPNLPPAHKQMALQMMNKQVHINRAILNADKTCTSWTANPDGTETKTTGTWSFADKQLTIKHDDATQKDTVLESAMRGDFLMLGKAKQKFAFKRKTE